jgi:hypothetical protein
VDRLPNSLSFRKVTTLNVIDESEIPDGFSGRVRIGDTAAPIAVHWYERGALHDPAHDVPAVTTYRATGDVKQIRHYHQGRLHDPAPGVPAVQGFFGDGTMKYAEHYRFGWRCDVGDTPAIRKWRADGSLRTVRHYRDNVRVDRPRTPHRPHH